ncbi:GH10211 [Drosophila grimshawi]|uniref:GH10211 n=1 Tax=Drosophila grimshawi TaxID=7222 RepID=B4JBH5_DROGR|nr:GH10211 [Drosophila grimshawi]
MTLLDDKIMANIDDDDDDDDDREGLRGSRGVQRGDRWRRGWSQAMALTMKLMCLQLSYMAKINVDFVSLCSNSNNSSSSSLDAFIMGHLFAA